MNKITLLLASSALFVTAGCYESTYPTYPVGRHDTEVFEPRMPSYVSPRLHEERFERHERHERHEEHRELRHEEHQEHRELRHEHHELNHEHHERH